MPSVGLLDRHVDIGMEPFDRSLDRGRRAVSFAVPLQMEEPDTIPQPSISDVERDWSDGRRLAKAQSLEFFSWHVRHPFQRRRAASTCTNPRSLLDVGSDCRQVRQALGGDAVCCGSIPTWLETSPGLRFIQDALGLGTQCVLFVMARPSSWRWREGWGSGSWPHEGRCPFWSPHHSSFSL